MGLAIRQVETFKNSTQYDHDFIIHDILHVLICCNMCLQYRSVDIQKSVGHFLLKCLGDTSILRRIHEVMLMKICSVLKHTLCYNRAVSIVKE